jgi:formate-dependent nitrite reductase membrane component NrfD
MLRVFKPQSAMSVGVWTLLGFSASASAAAFAQFLSDRYGPSFPVRVMERAGDAASLLFGLPYSNYTGVLIGATAIPVWNENAADLPIHFGMSGMAAAVGLLELMGNDQGRALQALGLGAALFECWEGLRIETRRTTTLNPLRRGGSGLVTRAGGLLSGPIPAAMRLISLFSRSKSRNSLRRAAAVSAVAGSLLTRIAWVYAGHESAKDWKIPLGIKS